ncbi:MAG: hypothetical protein O7E54_13930 [Planctomycetota bacterium]|nr:hypothetical protein [Planctomycetota bacterium]
MSFEDDLRHRVEAEYEVEVGYQDAREFSFHKVPPMFSGLYLLRTDSRDRTRRHPPGRTWAVLLKRGGVRKELGVAVPPEIGGLWDLDGEDFAHAEWARIGR